MSDYKISLNEIGEFLEGKDDEKYIVNIEYDSRTNLIHKIKNYPDGTKTIEQEPLTSFMWMKDMSTLMKVIKFYDNDALKIKKAREHYGIEISKLECGGNDRMLNGYKFLVKCNQGHNRMIEFFVKGGLRRGLYDPTNNIKDYFLILKPVEQYLISTGKRLYKGYNEYEEIERFCFDLETTGLDPEVNRIFLIGCKTNKGFEELFECEIEGDNADSSEAEAITKFFAAIDYVKPSIICGYNSATFDWPFIFKRCEILGIDIDKIAKTLNSTIAISNTRGTVKLGGETEDFTQTNMFGYSIIDIIHSVRSAQSIDSNMKSASLKYACQYNKIAKKNRVYIKGDKIIDYWVSKDKYFFDDITGCYLDKKPELISIKINDLLTTKKNSSILVLDGSEERSLCLKKSEIDVSEYEVIYVPIFETCEDGRLTWLSDTDLQKNKSNISKSISDILSKIKNGYDILLTEELISLVDKKMALVSPQTANFILKTFENIKKYVNNNWVEVDGKYIVRRYLMDDLWETLAVDNVYNQAPFMLTKLVPSYYQKINTMGKASLWSLIMTAWSYDKRLAIPISDEDRRYVGGLSMLMKVGASKNLRKMDFNSLYPAIGLVHDMFPDVDISGALKSFLKYFHYERFRAKDLSEEYKAKGDYKMQSFYKRKQLPLKIFINALSGALGSPLSFKWSDILSVEGITCRARQYLRLMIKFFVAKGYDPTVLDTDGVNFSALDIDESKFEYIGLGLNSEVKKGKKYTGVSALVAEFNDLYMRGEMALGLDGTWRSSLNLSRKNYALLENDGSISLTGNTIKTRKMPTYMEEFLEKGIKLLLEDKGYEFVQYYYDYIDKIYDKKIPLIKIATKAKVKKTINQYKNRGFNKNGEPLPKQAHMELLIRNNINAELGDTVYYVNNGTKKTSGDIETIKKCTLKAKEKIEYIEKYKKNPGKEYYEITENVNCYLIDKDIIENNPDYIGEYNAEKYINSFNNRVSSLLVVFDKSVRDNILITNPSEKKNWIISELELVNNQPEEEVDQDTMEHLMTPSEGEYIYWSKYGIEPDCWSSNSNSFVIPGLDIKVEL